MRKEASLEQWRELYEAGMRIKELKPWENFWDMDLIGLRRDKEEDTVFFSILGRGGECYGITVYEGYEGLNNFFMLAMQEKMNLTPSYAMGHQKNLTVYWGNREELTAAQRKIIKDLGYSFRGKNQWLYFLSFEPGYTPYNLDEAEVRRASGYLRDLEAALKWYKEEKINVDFENGNMLSGVFHKKKKTWDYKEAPLPFTAFQFGSLIITDEELLSDLAEVPKCNAVLEAEISAMGASVKDKKYDRPANPDLVLLGDAPSGMMLNAHMTEPEDEAMEVLAELVLDFIFQHGAPKEIRVSNLLIEAALEQICNVCGTKLRRVKRLSGMEDFISGLGRFVG